MNTPTDKLRGNGIDVVISDKVQAGSQSKDTTASTSRGSTPLASSHITDDRHDRENENASCQYCGRTKRGWRREYAETLCADCEKKTRE